jgi:outer membrane protein assembly factor BamB
MAAIAAALAAAAIPVHSNATDKLTYHHDAGRSGWNGAETILKPENVASDRFGLLWQSPQLDAVDGVPPRLFATPLYLSGLGFTSGQKLSVAFVVTTAGYAYAINTAPAGAFAPGAILWRNRLTAAPCSKGTMGNLGTPVIDRARGRLYVTSCTGEDWEWKVHALDLRTGAEMPGWPLATDAAAMSRPGINRNGSNRFVDGEVHIQRGALNLNRDGSRLYVAFGPDKQGWLLSIDTATPEVASAFSSTALREEEQGGMWGSSGATVDAQGRVTIATGANFGYTLAKRGIPGVFPDSAHSWGQSILQFSDEPGAGLRLIGTYTPYNYCQTAASDIDIGGSGAVMIDLPTRSSGTPHLLALGGGKQGNVYLLDRDHMPGGTTKRQACSSDPATDTSLLAPEVQVPLQARGPVSVFGPFSDSIGMSNSAKSRSTLAQFRGANGQVSLFLTGSSKTGPDYATNVPPGLVRVSLITRPGQPTFLRIDKLEMTQTFQNPGSPVVSSNGRRGGIVWLLDPNAPRSMDLFQPEAPGAMLYAFDARTLRRLWKSREELFPTGKYNEPTVVDGLVLVGTDRLQAFGLRTGSPGARAAMRNGAPAAAETRSSSGAALFQTHCSACHGPAARDAPTAAALARLPKAHVVEALTTGKMAPMASNMSPAQIAAIARYLSDGK